MQLDDGRLVSEFDLVARVLAERLQRPGASEGLHAALVSGLSAGWEDVATRATNEFVLPAFAAAVRDLGLIGSLAPELRAFLAMAHAANVKRNGGLRSQLAAVVGAVNREGVEPVLLKGAIRLVDGLYPDPGWRMMRDLDLLVPEDRLEDVVAALRGAGYAPRPPTAGEPDFGHHHYPELTRPSHRASVEVHAELFKTERQRRLLGAAEVSGAARPMAFDGVRARIPSVDLEGGPQHAAPDLRDRAGAAQSASSLRVGLHPDMVDTCLSAPFQATVPDGKLFTPDFAASRLLEVLDRIEPDDSGKVFAWNGQVIPP